MELPAKGSYVVLLSGGLDSTVLAYSLVRARLGVKAITVLYGQRHAREQQSAAAVASCLAIDHRVVDLSGLRPLLGASSLVDTSVAVPEGHYEDESMKSTIVPNRNMLLISVATAWSVALGFDGVAYAAHSGDHAIYPDCRNEFADAMDRAVQLCDYSPQRLLRPFVNIRKDEIVRVGASMGVPFELTWSCYKGGDAHCGKCGTCVERREAFALARVADPTVYTA